MTSVHKKVAIITSIHKKVAIMTSIHKKVSIITSIHKKGSIITSIQKKGGKRECKNYRGISVINTFSRIYGRILAKLIESEYKKMEMEKQSGF